ncbi:MAG: helix-turn-helix transcriptional regulator [Clostridia bacterium]|nr:helix-turn-helix transcriptional regulator [Clostridia bacterium]
MEIDYKEIGRRIAARRRTLHLKQSEVCERCDINDKYLSAIECARSIPSIEVLLRICDALETTPDTILLGVRRNSDHHLRSELTEVLQMLSDQQLTHVLSFAKWLFAQNEL